MTTRKRNEWLEKELSGDEEGAGVESDEEEEESRGRALGRGAKRRRVDESESGSESEGDEESEEEEGLAAMKGGKTKKKVVVRRGGSEEEDGSDDEGAEEREGRGDEEEEEEKKEKEKKVKPLTEKQLRKAQRAAKKTGVIYISRVPPFMKPHTLRHLLEPFGPLGRIFLTPEDPAKHRQRVRAGGNKKRSFTDGWVEFAHKADAQAAVAALNARIIGGKKGGWYHDDVWNLKYLKGFKWHHLTEQIANENAARAARMRAEIAQSTRENREFLANVERAKMLRGMEEKRKAKGVVGKGEGEGGQVEGEGAKQQKEPSAVRDRTMHFRQAQVKSKRAADAPDAVAQPPEEVKRVLSKIF